MIEHIGNMGDLLIFPLALGGVDIKKIKAKCLFLPTTIPVDNSLIEYFNEFDYVFLHDFFHYHHNHVEYSVNLKRTVPHPNLKIITATPHRDVYIHDFLWNLTKAYYTMPIDELYSLTNGLLWFYHHEAYVQPTILGQGNKIFLSANKIYKSNQDRIRRRQLVNLLEPYKNIGYLGKIFINDKAINKEEDTILRKSIELPGQIGGSATFNPVHQDIYDDTFLSIYVESLETGMTAPTEKTYFPLIKGHFILPFSGPYLIKQLINQGWKLPNFIDYSYDQIENDNARWAAYTKEIQRLLTYPVSFFKEKVIEHADDLWHNVNMVHMKSYNSLLPLLKKVM